MTDPVTRDDLLLDLLGSGARPQTSDPVIDALYAWRTDLSAGAGAEPAGVPTPVVARSRRRRAAGNRSRRRIGMVAALLGLSASLAGVGATAAGAEPGSPLWPVTKVLYPDTAADRAAGAAAAEDLRRAREALAEGRLADAERYLDDAGHRAGATDAATAARIRRQIAAVRDQLRDRRVAPQPSTPGDNGGSPDVGDSTRDDRTSPPEPPATPEPGKPSHGGPGGKSGKTGPADGTAGTTGVRPERGRDVAHGERSWTRPLDTAGPQPKGLRRATT